MTTSDTNNARPRGSWIKFLLFPFVLLLLTAVPALADDCVADRGGVIDGAVNPVPPSQIQIDGNCTIRNFPASNPLSSNISFFTQPGQNNQRWLIIFDNVVHTGQMACNAVLGHRIWFTNGSSSGIHASCQNLLIPVEKINKQNPPGQTTATVGVPFTYKLTSPVLFDPATGTVINSSGSPNDLHSITIWDDLNATGADLSYVSHVAYWLDNGTPVPHTFSNVGGLLTFDNIPVVTAGRQFVIEVTVVLNDTPTNTPGKQFRNTAKWDFGRLIDGVYYEPLPGEWGVTPPLTIAAPSLVVTKSGPATMNLGQWGDFVVDVRNVGLSDAWDVTVRDLLPAGATGGMCNLTPQMVSARVFAADGATTIPGKGALIQGSDYSLDYSATPCRVDLTMLTPAGVIGPNQRLILRYRTKLDAGTQNGTMLTNVAGAIQWFNGASSNPSRVTSTRSLTDGTVGILDHQDAHTVTVAITGYFFEKTVANLTTGLSLTRTAAPGDRLRYTLRFLTTDQALNNFRIYDEMDALNSALGFAPGTLTLVSYPPGADISATSSTGGPKGTGVLDVRNLSLPVNGQLQVQFDITLKSDLANGTVVTNQATARLADGTAVALSDDPTINGAADPMVSGDEEPTRVIIAAAPAFRIQKISTDMTGDPNVLLVGDTLRYTITVKNIGNLKAVNVTLRDAVPVNTTYVPGSTTLNGALVPDSGGQSPLVNGMLINSPVDATPGSMTADASSSTANVATIIFDVTVNPNVPGGTVISNQGFVTAASGGILDQPSDDPDTPVSNDPTRDVVSAPAFRIQKISTDLTGDPSILLTGDTLHYAITVKNIGNANAANVVLRDLIPANTTYVAGSTTLNGAPVPDSSGASPLASGMRINSPADTTPGSMPADPSSSTANVATITFDVTVNPSVPSGTVISNQGFVSAAGGIVDLPSDDPRTPAANDPTRDIVAAATFRIQKISTDLTGDPSVLLAGDTLRYTITVKNIGTVNAVNVVLRDAVPANTTYVGRSTTLNGAPVPDSANTSPLVNGMLINSPANATPGSMPADASASTANIATITFDVVINANVANGTVISNQGFVTAIDSGIVDQPSDDPRTPIVNDPTRDIVPGTLPLLYAEKRVALFIDRGSPGIIDPGDVLRYTITVQNSAAVPTTGVVVTDTVPANTTYVANSTLLNGLPVGQPDGGVSPLASSINISSSDRTPPLPGAGAGTISANATATLQFDLLVNAGTAAGTLISNQAVVHSVQLPNLLTDGDGNPATGPEPTVVVVGATQQLSITKDVTVVGGGPAVPGAVLEYTVRATNVAAVPVPSVVITDDLDASRPGQLAYVTGSATMNGVTTGVSVTGSTITVDYAAGNGALAPGAIVVLRFRATLNPTLTLGTVVTNTGVVAWNNPTQTASASVSIVVGNTPGLGMLSGSVWHDTNFDNSRDSGERALAGWAVDLYRNNQPWQSVLTDDNGDYRINSVEPNDRAGVQYELRFSAPGAGTNTAMLGVTASPFTNGMQRITNIVVPSGADLKGLDLPIHPNGVIYNSIVRRPVAGASLALLSAGSRAPLPAGCFDDTAQQGQITLADGYYKFDINFSDPACPSGGDYLIDVTAPGASYSAGYSQIMRPTSDASTAAFSVPACPGSANDVIPGTALFCEVQPSEFAPPASVAARSAGTIYHVHVMLDNSRAPGTSQIFNNHIPVDPQINGSISISKTTPMRDVTRGQLVPYVITLNNRTNTTITDVSLVDRMPAGFTYIAGSALLDGVPTEPVVADRALSWNGVTIASTQVRTVKLLLAVGAGAAEGEYVNRAQAMNSATGGAMSGEATATVRIMPDATFDCTDVTGKVFNDANRNGVQDNGENGLPGVRVVTATGLQATTDQYGRYHITCAITPNENRGSNFVLKLDDRTLPSGFRLSTDQVQVKRATRGKTLPINFGASIHRVVAIDLSDAAFEPGKTDIRVQWRPRIDVLLEELRKAPAVLRLSYVADTEDAALVERRIQAIKRQLTQAWVAAKDSDALIIEPEVFWRRGAPPKRTNVRVPESR